MKNLGNSTTSDPKTLVFWKNCVRLFFLIAPFVLLSGRNASPCTGSMLDEPAATSTPMSQMFCFGQWSSSFPQLLCQPHWSSSRLAAIFQPRYLDYRFSDQNVYQHKAWYGDMCILGQKREQLLSLKGPLKGFCVTELPYLERGVVRWGRGSILWDWSWECRLPPGLSPNLKPRDKLPLSDFHFWNSKAYTALLIVTFLPSEQWELFQPDRHLIGATVTFCNWESPCKTHWNTIPFFIFKVSVPPPNPPRLHLHIWKRK